VRTGCASIFWAHLRHHANGVDAPHGVHTAAMPRRYHVFPELRDLVAREPRSAPARAAGGDHVPLVFSNAAPRRMSGQLLQAIGWNLLFDAHTYRDAPNHRAKPALHGFHFLLRSTISTHNRCALSTTCWKTCVPRTASHVDGPWVSSVRRVCHTVDFPGILIRNCRLKSAPLDCRAPKANVNPRDLKALAQSSEAPNWERIRPPRSPRSSRPRRASLYRHFASKGADVSRA